MSSSQPGRMVSSASRIVTLEPRSARSEANSHPTTPPPMTTAEAGSSLRSRNSSDVMIKRPSTSKPGSRNGTDPAARTTFRPTMTRPASSPSTTSTRWSALSVPVPDQRGDLAPLEQAGQALEELVHHGVLAVLAHREVDRRPRRCRSRTPWSPRPSGRPRPSRGTPWPGCSLGAGRYRPPCPARRWRRRGPLRRRRAQWRSRRDHRRSRRCRTRPRLPSPFLSLCAHDVRPARSASPEQPDRTGESPLHALRVTSAAYRSDRTAPQYRLPALLSRSFRSPDRPPAVANSSTLSFQRSPEWPFTQRKLTATSEASASSMQRLPQVAVGHRLVLRVLPAAALPAPPPPVGEALDDVGRVAHHLHPVGRVGRQRPQGLERRGDLHALIGRVALGAAGVGPAGHGPGPPARTGIAPARAVGVHDDRAALG